MRILTTELSMIKQVWLQRRLVLIQRLKRKAKQIPDAFSYYRLIELEQAVQARLKKV